LKAADEAQILATQSQELTAEFGKGLAASNLRYIRLFNEAYAGDKKVPPLLTQLPWTHNLILPGQSKRELEQQFRQALLEGSILHLLKVAPAVRQIHDEAAARVFKDAYVPFLPVFFNSERTAFGIELETLHRAVGQGTTDDMIKAGKN
jgi:hypothetical protein